MRKLTLKLEALQVESFDTAPTAADNGTVYGEQCTCFTNCTCPGCPTCDATCEASCNGTCNGCESQYCVSALCTSDCATYGEGPFYREACYIYEIP